MLIIFVFLITFSGCYVKSEIIDELSIIRAIGYDIDGMDKKIRITVTFPTFTEQISEQMLEQVSLSAVGETPRAVINHLNNRSQKPLVTGQLRVALFGEPLAKEGLEPYILPLYRDPTVGNRILMAVVEDGQAYDILKGTVGTGEQVGVYIPDFLDQNQTHGQVPRTNLHEYLFSMYSDVRDPVLPIIKTLGDENIEIAGLALFSRDKMVDQLSLEQSFYLKLMRKRSDHSFQEFYVEEIKQKWPVVIEVLKSNIHKKYTEKGDTKTVKYKLDIVTTIFDTTSSVNLYTGNDIEKIEKAVKEDIEERCKELLYHFQELKIDPVGAGEIYRSKHRDWNVESWENEIYQSLQFEVEADVRISQTGAIE
ncbi:hypothetical protein AB990_14990 [Alkalihalobacillus pseudalcaliphilus]|nr:hypothetical protein AB990_14990 [Alkalihalobacillus pseudalcaliphilus]